MWPTDTSRLWAVLPEPALSPLAVTFPGLCPLLQAAPGPELLLGSQQHSCNLHTLTWVTSIHSDLKVTAYGAPNLDSVSLCARQPRETALTQEPTLTLLSTSAQGQERQKSEGQWARQLQRVIIRKGFPTASGAQAGLGVASKSPRGSQELASPVTRSSN